MTSSYCGEMEYICYELSVSLNVKIQLDWKAWPIPQQLRRGTSDTLSIFILFMYSSIKTLTLWLFCDDVDSNLSSLPLFGVAMRIKVSFPCVDRHAAKFRNFHQQHFRDRKSRVVWRYIDTFTEAMTCLCPLDNNIAIGKYLSNHA